MKIFLFDVLAFNERSLCHLPLIERRKYLDEIVDGELLIKAYSADLDHVNIIDQLKQMSGRAKDEGVEGLVIKSLTSQYETSGTRVNTWLKLKNIHMN